MTIINRTLPMNLLKAYFVDRTKEFIYMSRVEKFSRKVIRSLGNGKSKAFMWYFRHQFKIASMNMRLPQNGLFTWKHVAQVLKKKKEKKKTTHRFQCGKFSLVHDRKVTNHLLMLRTKKSLCSSSQVSIVWFRNYWKLFWFLLCCALRLAFEPTYILHLYVRFHEKPNLN